MQRLLQHVLEERRVQRARERVARGGGAARRERHLDAEGGHGLDAARGLHSLGRHQEQPTERGERRGGPRAARGGGSGDARAVVAARRGKLLEGELAQV